MTYRIIIELQDAATAEYMKAGLESMGLQNIEIVAR